MSPSPLGSPPAAPVGEGGYKFLHIEDGRPTTYDACRPIHYVVRSHGENSTLRRALDEAITATSNATGLQFVYDGPVDEAPSERREVYQLDNYGDRWAPVLIAFSDPIESRKLAGESIGRGGSSPIGVQGSDARFVSGQVEVDTPELLESTTENQFSLAKHVFLHELGHLVGLDHVDDPGQVMYQEAGALTRYSVGDLRGLAQLGSGGCAPSL